MTPQIELRSDLNAEDDEGQNWTLLDNATNPSRVYVGVVLVAGTSRFWSVVRIMAVDADGRVHFVQLDGSDPDASLLPRWTSRQTTPQAACRPRQSIGRRSASSLELLEYRISPMR